MTAPWANAQLRPVSGGASASRSGPPSWTGPRKTPPPSPGKKPTPARSWGNNNANNNLAVNHARTGTPSGSWGNKNGNKSVPATPSRSWGNNNNNKPVPSPSHSPAPSRSWNKPSPAPSPTPSPTPSAFSAVNIQSTPATPDNGSQWKKQRRANVGGGASKSTVGKFSFRAALNRANEQSIQIIEQFDQKYNECCRCWGLCGCCQPCNIIDCCKSSDGSSHMDKWSDSPYTWVMENRVEWNRAWPYQCGRAVDYSSKHDEPIPCQTTCCCFWGLRWHCCMSVSDSISVVNYDKFSKAHPVCGWAFCMKEICGIGEAVALLKPCSFPLCCMSTPRYIIKDVKNPKGLADSINRSKSAHTRANGWKSGTTFMQTSRSFVCDFPCACIDMKDV